MGLPVEATNPHWQAYERELAGTACSLSLSARRIVHDTITAHCRFRRWELLALNVRTQHTHVVVRCGDTPPEEALTQFKAWCTRRLRENGLAPAGTKLWTVHGSTRYLWDMNSLEGAVTYVRDEQGRSLV